MQKFEHFGAKIKNRPKSSLRTFLHGALQLLRGQSYDMHNFSFFVTQYSLAKVEKCMAFFSVDGQSNIAIALEFLIFI